MSEGPAVERLSSGIVGLDEILQGGLIPGRAYLVRGGPGAGKTTLGLHFLTAAAAGEKPLFITLEEPEARIRKNAAGMGFDLNGVAFLDLSPTSEFFAETQTYDIFSPAEVEREPTTKKIVEEIARRKPRRVFLDPMTQFRYLSSDLCQFRKQVLSFLRLLVDQGATVLFTSEGSQESPDDDLQFMSDGYQLSMRGENLGAHLHALAKYLQNMGVVVLLVTEIQDVVGNFRVSDLGISYLGDNVVFLRFLEINGELRKAIGVLKKRLSNFEKTLREFEITRYGIKVGRPLTGLRGILLGTPEWVGDAKSGG